MSGKWPGFDSNKQNLNAFHMLNKLKPLTRLWSDAKHMFSFLKFCSYFKANGPDSFHFLLKVLLPSKFISKSISWPLKWPRKQQGQSLWQFCSLAALLLGNCGHYTKPAEIRNIGQSKITLSLAILMGITWARISDSIINSTMQQPLAVGSQGNIDWKHSSNKF